MIQVRESCLRPPQARTAESDGREWAHDRKSTSVGQCSDRDTSSSDSLKETESEANVICFCSQDLFQGSERRRIGPTQVTNQLLGSERYRKLTNIFSTSLIGDVVRYGNL